MSTGNNDFSSVSDRAAIILDELMTAMKYDRPCICLAVYRSEYLRGEVSSRLENSLREQGSLPVEYCVDKAHFDIPLELLHHPTRQRSVFFVNGVRWGGGRGYSKAYRALNVHREYLVEGKVRSLFWLSMSEARLLPRYAPDFWAFRTSVTEFLDLPSNADGPTREAVTTLTARPDHDDSDPLLLKKTARAYGQTGCFEDALRYYHRALRYTPGDNSCWLAIASIHIQAMHPSSARRVLNRLNGLSGNDPGTQTEIIRLSRMVKSLEHISISYPG